MKTIYKFIFLVLIIYTIPRIDCNASELKLGPYAVGFESYKTFDNSRLYQLGEDTISRPLLIHFWYPVKEKNSGSDIEFRQYIDLITLREDFNKPESEIDENSFNYVQAYSGFAKHNFALDTNVCTQDILNSPVNAKSGVPIHDLDLEFPLLIYAPSNSKSSVQNHILCEYLASHGYMILSVASAGPVSIIRDDIKNSTMAQVEDMEFILKYCEDSLQIRYTNLGLFGFSSGGNAITIYQMRNRSVDAVFSLDGGQEYGAYMSLYKMEDFDLSRTGVPYCSVVNNYENFSIYPVYNSIVTPEKCMFQMPHLDHNGFISHWRFFESCSRDSLESPAAISYDYLCRCSLGFFNKYLKPESFTDDTHFFIEDNKGYILSVDRKNSLASDLCNTLLDIGLDSTIVMLNDNKAEFFEDEIQIRILAKMYSDVSIDASIWLCQNNVDFHSDSWQAQYELAFMYKKNGENHMAKNALLKAKALNPENTEITNLLNEVNKLE